ncbi:MAG: hypothetical protein HPY76_01690 [Anaerolineae bacterium]|nr:hypothetical protein [Anaerolineae bacterium]
MAEKVDGIVEAVRYDDGGCIEMVRMYERRGPTYSDHILVNRAELVERLHKHKKIYAGTRQEFMAGTFQVTLPVRLVQSDNREVVTTTSDTNPCDNLTGVPLF